MIRRCACCGTDLPGEAPEGGLSDGRVSHGMCAACEVALTAELGVPLERFLESLDVPVLMVDVERGGRVTLANAPALDATGREAAEVSDRLLGDVFECANASLPGGCGQTVHCSGCVIRSTVERTWSTGEPSVRVPATLEPRRRNGGRTVDLVVSAERAGDRVMLTIHRYEA